MENPILYLPSIVSQSCFTDAGGEMVDLKKIEIDYFYLMLFLYTKELLSETPNLLIKDGKRYYFDESIPYKSVEIELSDFHKYGVVQNHKYENLKLFIENLSKLFINTNILRKNKDKDIETIKVIDTHSWDSTLLTISFTKKFVKELIGVKDFFMKVDLTNLFELGGTKSKSIYLLLKDYSNSGNKNIKSDELKLLIGNIPQKSTFDKIINEINEKTDIKISYTVEGIRKKVYKFTIRRKSNPKSKNTKKEIDTEVMDKSKKRLQKMKQKGVKIQDEEAYVHGIYNNEMKKQNPIPREKTDSDIELENFIAESMAFLNLNEEIDYKKKNYLMLSVGNQDFFIQNDYRLLSKFKIYDMKTETNNSSETLEFIYNNKVERNIFTAQGNGIKDCEIILIKPL